MTTYALEDLEPVYGTAALADRHRDYARLAHDAAQAWAYTAARPALPPPVVAHLLAAADALEAASVALHEALDLEFP